MSAYTHPEHTAHPEPRYFRPRRVYPRHEGAVVLAVCAGLLALFLVLATCWGPP